ncbi:hypothetical protein [Deinococcus pimensis]|uniref:hypothetical protein n=1 Tax=Deinococcus pimensis TaxID=309888 RepID=UPI0004891466|nr:hypothetical protein [Deinococcus pimensis]
MPFIQLALLGYGVALALVPTTLAGALLVRRTRGEGWEVPLEWSPELEGILDPPPGTPRVVRTTETRAARGTPDERGPVPT